MLHRIKVNLLFIRQIYFFISFQFSIHCFGFDCLGSRTIRTEEAILISLAALDDKMKPEHPPKEFDLAHSIPQSEDTGFKQIADGPSKRKQHKKMEKHQESFEQSNDSANESIG